jgi:hypothetical protein
LSIQSDINSGVSAIVGSKPRKRHASRSRSHPRASRPRASRAPRGGAVASAVHSTHHAAKPSSHPDFTTVSHNAKKYGVPANILWGVYGIESSYGANPSKNSLGYDGPFQFGPNEWRTYGGGNIKNVGTSADHAAHYLADLKKKYGSWDAALKHYSGGGYGLSAALSAGSKNRNAANSIGAVGGIAAQPTLSQLQSMGIHPVNPGPNSNLRAGFKILRDKNGKQVGTLGPDGTPHLNGNVSIPFGVNAPSIIPGIGDPFGKQLGGLNAAINPTGSGAPVFSLSDFFSGLVSAALWVRIGKVVLGGVLLLIGAWWLIRAGMGNNKPVKSPLKLVKRI